MKIEELRHALDDLAGDEPEVDDAFGRVTSKVRKHRARTWAAATACVLVVAVATVGAVQLRSNEDHKVSVVNPSPSPGNVADFTWNRVPAPAMNINRIVTVDGKTYAVGSSPDRKAAIAELDATGAVTTTVNPATGYNIPPKSGSVNDLIVIPGALVAVGETTGVGAPHADAWRSTDGGQTWSGSAVETSTDGPLPSINRVVFSNGVVYAIGTPSDTTSTSHCLSNAWTSKDGTDFHLMHSSVMCAGPSDAVDGPAGILITTSGNATAWTRSGNEWSPHRIPTNASDPNAGIEGLAGDDRGYVAVGSFADNSASAGAIWWSADGRVWKHVVTARGSADPRGAWALFTGVAHTQAGWIAVGARGHRDKAPKMSDAMVWTSSDGEHWTESTRDGKSFEQFARLNDIGTTADGFAIRGLANMTTDKLGTAIYDDNMLWLGSASNAVSGIVEGSMHEIGGPAPGLYKPIPGTLIATGTDGELHTTAVDKNGRFAIALPPGEYRITGHSPQYGNGTYMCGANPTPTVVHDDTVTHLELYCSLG